MPSPGRVGARWAAALCLLTGLLLASGAGVARGATADGSAAQALPFDAFLHSTQSFFQAVRFGFLHEDPHLAPRGALIAQVSTNWSNTYIDDPQRIHLDVETVYVRPRVAYVLSDAVEVSLQAPTMWMGGGHLDSLIDRWHGLTRIYREGRDKLPRDQFSLEFRQPGPPPNATTVVLSSANEGTLRLAPVLSLRWRLTARDAATAATLTASADFPSAEQPNPIVARRGHDTALGLAIGGPLYDRIAGMFSVAVTRPRSGRIVGFADPAPLVGSFMFGVGALWRPGQSLLAELLSETPMTRHSKTGFDQPANELLVGWKGVVRPKLVVEAAFMENLVADNNDADVGFHFAVTRQL